MFSIRSFSQHHNSRRLQRVQADESSNKKTIDGISDSDGVTSHNAIDPFAQTKFMLSYI